MKLRTLIILLTAAAMSCTAAADVCQHEIEATDSYSEAMYFYPCGMTEALPGITLTGGYSNTYRHLQWMAEAMAESGYVVLAMTPVNKYGKVEQWRDAHLRGQEVLVTTASNDASPLGGKIDTNKRAITGFSMGGGGTLLAGTLLKDEVKALTAFAPFLLEEQRDVAPTAPTMILAGERDLLVTNDSIDQIYDNVQKSAERNFLAVYGDGRHQQWYRPEITKNRDSYIQLTLAWLDLHLKDDPDAAEVLKTAQTQDKDRFSTLKLAF